jgi:hypothetical protein
MPLIDAELEQSSVTAGQADPRGAQVYAARVDRRAKVSITRRAAVSTAGLRTGIRKIRRLLGRQRHAHELSLSDRGHGDPSMVHSVVPVGLVQGCRARRNRPAGTSSNGQTSRSTGIRSSAVAVAPTAAPPRSQVCSDGCRHRLPPVDGAVRSPPGQHRGGKGEPVRAPRGLEGCHVRRTGSRLQLPPRFTASGAARGAAHSHHRRSSTPDATHRSRLSWVV